MEPLTHRERVNRTLAHREPDRVPLDMWGTDSRLLDTFYFRVLDHLGWRERGTLERPGKTAQYVDWRLSDRFDCDFRHLTLRPPRRFEKRTDAEGITYDEWGVGYRKVGENVFIARHPFPEPDVALIGRHRWPDPRDPGRVEGLTEQARAWFEQTDYAITTTTPISGFIMDIYQYLRGTEGFFIDLLTEEAFAHALIERIAAVVGDLYACMVEPIAPYLTWIEFAEDHGTQNGLFYSADLYRKFLQKPERDIFRRMKRLAPQAKITLHCCGSMRELIPDLIDTGVEVLSSLQPLARGMDSAELKREFGKDLVFHGGIDLQRAMVGTRGQVVAETRRRLRDYAPGGGYIAAPSNHFTGDVPVENFFALYETARDAGRYPIGAR